MLNTEDDFCQRVDKEDSSSSHSIRLPFGGKLPVQAMLDFLQESPEKSPKENFSTMMLAQYRGMIDYIERVI